MTNAIEIKCGKCGEVAAFASLPSQKEIAAILPPQFRAFASVIKPEMISHVLVAVLNSECVKCRNSAAT